MRRRLEEAEDQIHQRNSEASQQQSKDTQAAMAQAAELENRKLELEQYKVDKDSDTKIYIEQLKLSMQPDEVVEDDGVVNPLDVEKLNLDKEKVKNSHYEKMLALKQDMEKHKDTMEAKKVDQSINRIKKKSVK
jgi:hypothetical protein